MNKNRNEIYINKISDDIHKILENYLFEPNNKDIRNSIYKDIMDYIKNYFTTIVI